MPDSSLRLAVLISGGGSTLQNLWEHVSDGRLRGVEIALVISSRREVRGVAIARDAGLPTEVIRVRDYPDMPAFSEAIADALDRAAVDLVVMAGFLCLWHIPPRYTGRVLNIHPAPLPNFGGKGMFGRHVHEAVLNAGRTTSGCTVHLADNEYDHGPVIAQQTVGVAPDDTPETLGARVQAAERELYPRVIQEVADRGVAWLRAQAESSR